MSEERNQLSGRRSDWMNDGREAENLTALL